MRKIFILLLLMLISSLSADFPRPWEIVFYTNSTVAYCNVTIDGQPAAIGDEVGAFVAGECRGLGTMVWSGEQTVSTMNIQGNVIEQVEFAVWDSSADLVCSVAYTTNTLPGGDIGYPPDLLPIAAVSDPSQNLVPVWSLPDSISWPEDTGYALDLDFYAFDPEGENLAFSCLQDGDIEVNIISRTAYLQPPANYFGSSDIVFSASDGVNTVNDTVMAVVLPVNDPPVVFMSNDFSFEEDGQLEIDLSDYVFDPDNDPLQITIFNNYHIQWSVQEMTLLLSADENWNGTENLQLMAYDGAAADYDNFLVTITPVNDEPVLDLPEEVSFPEDGSLSLNLDNYASDPDGDPLSYDFVPGENIFGDLNGNILILYATENWFGSEEISITVMDIEAATAFDLMLVNVTAVNDAPHIVLPDSLSFQEDSSLFVDFSEFVSDVDEDSLSLLVSGNLHINVQITGLEVTLSAAANWWGEEFLQFTVSDGQVRASASEQVLVQVTAVNDPPIIDLPAVFNFYSYSELTEDFSEYISDVDDDDLVLEVFPPNDITVEINGMLVTLSAEPGWFGSERVSFVVSDTQTTAGDSVLVEVLQQSDLPDIILPAALNFAEDTQIVRDFSAYIFNAEGFVLELSAFGNQQINLQINDLEVTMSAPENWWGTEEVFFAITDIEAGFSTYDSLLVNLTPVNDPPQIDLPESITFYEDSLFMLDCSQYITDVDNEDFSLSVSGNQDILVGIAGMNLNFEPAADFYGTEIHLVTVNDNSGRAIDTDSLLVIVEPVNDPPVVNFPAQLIWLEDNLYELPVFDYLSDVDGDSLEVDFSSDFGCDFVWQEVLVQLVPPEDFYGSGLIYAYVSDGIEALVADIQVIIQPVNDPPVIDLPDNFYFDEDTAFSFDIMDYAYDADYDNLLVSYSGPFFIFVEITGTTVELEPLANWNGSADMTFTVDDGSLSSQDEVEIIVNPVNDPPALNSFLPADTELLYYGETQVSFSVNVYDSDSELTYNWLINGEDMENNASVFTHTFSESGEFLVEVIAADEEFQVSQQWSVTIYSGPDWQLVIYTNSTVAYSVVTIDDQPAEEEDLVGAFVNGECRGIGEIVVVNNIAYSSFLIQGETVEQVNFKVYSASNEAVYDVAFTTQTNPGGDLGNPPYDLLPLAAYSSPGPGWTVTDQYLLFTTVYTQITLDGEAAADADSLGAFDSQDVCLGMCDIVLDQGIAYATIDVFQDDTADFSFKLWNAASNTVFIDYNFYETVPGGSIGAPGEEIVLAFSSAPEPDWQPVVYTNSTTGYFVITVNGSPASENDLLGIFIDDECRGVGTIISYEEEAVSTVEIQGEEIEMCSFRLWDASLLQVLDLDLTIQTNPGGDIGYPPNEIELDFWSYDLPEFQVFPRPWNVVYYTNSTVAYGCVSIDDEPAPPDNEIAAFINGECRGLANTVDNAEQTIFTMNIQGDSPEIVQFNYYDVSQNLIYSIEYLTLTCPGGDIGYPPNLLPLQIITNFPPIVNLPQQFSFDEDEEVTLDLNEFIYDPDDDPLTFSVSGNLNIDIQIDGMMVTACGEPDWFGTEFIEYLVDDGHGHIINGSLELIVLPVNDPPDVSLPYSFTLQEDQNLEVDFSLFISDVEDDDWTLSQSGAENISVTITDAMVQFVPDENWNGSEWITFYADDGYDTGSDDLLVIVNPQPDAPIVDFPDQLLIYENANLTLNMYDYITDPDGDDFDVFAEGNQNITVTVADDSITFMPLPDWYGTETITINADDNTSRLIGSDEVEVIVEFVHQPPELFLPDDFTIMEDEIESFDLTPCFYIYEGEEFLFTAAGNDSIIIAFDQAQMTLSAPENWFGSETVVITLDDEPSRLTVSDTIDIIVEPVNDPPVLLAWLPEDLEPEVYVDSAVTFSVEVSDIEGDVVYSWLLDGSQLTETENQFMIAFSQAGEYEIECLAADEDEQVVVTWLLSVVAMDEDTDQINSTTVLFGNYPNPFNPQTTISYCLVPSELPAELSIYNLRGQIINSWQINTSGLNKTVWNGTDLQGKKQPSGVYLYNLRCRSKSFTRRLLLLK